MCVIDVCTHTISRCIHYAHGLATDLLLGKEIFLVSKVSRPVMGSTQPSTEWVSEILFPGGKAAGAWG